MGICFLTSTSLTTTSSTLAMVRFIHATPTLVMLGRLELETILRMPWSLCIAWISQYYCNRCGREMPNIRLERAQPNHAMDNSTATRLLRLVCSLKGRGLFSGKKHKSTAVDKSVYFQLQYCFRHNADLSLHPTHRKRRFSSFNVQTISIEAVVDSGGHRQPFGVRRRIDLTPIS